MKLVVGLGNPGAEYSQTRHNAGFLVLDELADRLGAGEWKSIRDFEADITEHGAGEGKVLLVKPTTYMNNSGRSVERLRAYYKCEPTDIVCVHDELALPFGSVRTRLGGQAAGHNGVASLIHHLGTDQFWRVRVGVETEHPERSANPTGFVLGRFSDDEEPVLRAVVDRSAALLVESLSSGEFTETTLTIK